MRPLIFYALVVALIGSVAVQAQAPAGGEFRVNNATSIAAFQPRVATDGSGRYVVAWTDANGVVRARRFDAAGVPLGSELLVGHAGAAPAVPASTVAADERGRFVVAWEGNDGDDRGIFGQRFDASGTRVGEAFRANTYTAMRQERPEVAMLAGGAFVVVWSDRRGDGSGDGVFGQVYDSTGVPFFPFDFRVNSYTTLNQFLPKVVAQSGNRYVVTWTSALQNGGTRGVYGQLMDGVLAQGPEFRVNTDVTGTHVASALVRGDRGGFVPLWNFLPAVDFPIRGRRFDSLGAPQGAEFVVQTFTPNPPGHVGASADAVGDFTVAWDIGTGFSQVLARRFHPTGQPRGPAFQVNTYTTLYSFPLTTVGVDGSGNFLVAWGTNEFGSLDIVGRRFGGLRPAGLTVSDGANGVLEVPEDFALVTSWRNVNGVAQTFQGRASEVTPTPGLLLTLSLDASYGTVANGATGSCSNPCFAGAVTGPRPQGHVDFTLLERILPDVQGQAQRWSVHVGDSFADVPRTSLFYRSVETLLHHGVTAGCAANTYCPANGTLREQMATFVLTAKEGPSYQPRPCNTPRFQDVPASSPFCPWIEELARRGVTSGCGGANFCPGAVVTREQMAVFVLRTLEPLLEPLPCSPPNIFSDVPETSPYCRWIEELARRGVVGGCGGGNYCPTAAVTREQMAVFLTGTFGLALYGP